MLNIDCEELGNFTSGQVITIFSTDLEKIPQLMNYIASGCASIINLFILALIIGYYYGPFPALAFYCTVSLMVAIQSFLAYKQGSLRKDIAIKSDKKILFMNEILSGMKTIKMQVWESFFIKNIGKLRQNEMLAYIHSFIYKIVYRVISMIGLRLPLLIIFISTKSINFTSISEQNLNSLLVLLIPFEFEIHLIIPEFIFAFKEFFKSQERIEVEEIFFFFF